MAAVVEESCRLLEPLAAERRVVLLPRLEPVACRVDRERFAEVAANLIGNAVLYNREGGRVEINLCKRGEQVLLEVADTGIGISADELPHIFDRFYRVDKARSGNSAGTGLGLAITKWIVEAHGGTISVSSQCGHGTTFAVLFPPN